MLAAIITNIAEPISRRVGTFASGALTAMGATSEQVDVIVLGLLALVGLLFDLIVVKVRRTEQERRK